MIWYNNFKDFQDITSIVKDIVFVFGGFGIIKYLINRNFNNKVLEIQKDKEKRLEIEEKLADYVLEKHKNGVSAIALRSIYWKNYPWKLNDDGYRQHLKIDYHNNNILLGSWINKKSIFFRKYLMHPYGESVYVDKYGIFFVDKRNKKFKGFCEIKNVDLIYSLPFSNIINFDFKDFIEYEAIIYTKYKYNSKKLFDDEIKCREALNQEYQNIQLQQKFQIKKYNKILILIKRLLILCLVTKT